MELSIREPGSAITHFIAMLLAVAASVPLLLKAGMSSGMRCTVAMGIFMCSMILLYGASTMYHSVNVIHDIQKGGKFTGASVRAVYAVADGNETDALLAKQNLGVKACL